MSYLPDWTSRVSPFKDSVKFPVVIGYLYELEEEGKRGLYMVIREEGTNDWAIASCHKVGDELVRIDENPIIKKLTHELASQLEQPFDVRWETIRLENDGLS